MKSIKNVLILYKNEPEFENYDTKDIETIIKCGYRNTKIVGFTKEVVVVVKPNINKRITRRNFNSDMSFRSSNSLLNIIDEMIRKSYSIYINDFKNKIEEVLKCESKTF